MHPRGAVATRSALLIGYLIIALRSLGLAQSGPCAVWALRSLGLDCGPMAGFKASEASRALVTDGGFMASPVINIGFGTRDTLRPRLPRLMVDQVILTP